MPQLRAFLTLLAFSSLCACASNYGRSSLPAPPPAIERANQPATVKYTLLHSFSEGSDGYYPHSELLDLNGILYGTTPNGGAYGKGTIFSLTTSGTERVLHSFGKGTDGAIPESGLVDVNGVLYGTTFAGGRYARGSQRGGTIFSVTTAGKEKVLDNFGKHYAPENPYAALTNVNGTLYGTTESGGAYNSGTVFSVTTAGEVQIVHSFNEKDGRLPVARLVAMKGVLYGTTELGGTSSHGNIFGVSLKGFFKNLYNFGKGLEKANLPWTGLTDLNGVLYGTTLRGGKANAGIVFAISPNGNAKVLHSFSLRQDGQFPTGDLIVVKGVLYGTTRCGGAYSSYCRSSGGPALGGTVFSITPAGKETVMYSLGDKPSNSVEPYAGLIAVHNTLFGTTTYGGAYGDYGTVYSLQLNP